jgi:hypothetical protein
MNSKEKLAYDLLAVVLGFLGIGLVWWASNFGTAIGIFLMIWGNNAGLFNIFKKIKD